MRDDALGVIIPSLGRPATLHETLLSVLGQSRQPGQIIVSVPDDSHLAPESRQLAITFVRSETGLCRQRNRAIEALQPGIERVTFLDDDIELHADYFEQVAQLFAAHPEVVLADGKVLRDARDMSRAEAQAIIAAAATPHGAAVKTIGPQLAYGCNLTVRRNALAKLRFDERLPLYGYMEDRDFAFGCARLGAVMRCDSAMLVHLRPTAGRISARRFGFSQVMNPLYLWSKGNYVTRRHVAWQVCRPFLINGARAVASNEKALRWRQFAGNCYALTLALRGRIAPEEMLRL
jgi:GT2 family glycosyltransferase